MIATKRKLLFGHSCYRFQLDGLWERTSLDWHRGFATKHKIHWNTASWATGKWKNGIAFEIERHGRRSTKILLMQDDDFYLVNEKKRAPFYVDVIENSGEFGMTILPLLEEFANKNK